MSILHRIGICATLYLALACANSALAGRIVCWTNDEGVRECGSSVPPQYIDKRREILNERGMVVHVTPAAKTEEQRAEEERLAKLAEQERQREEAKRREDEILLKTFTTERDVLIARDSKIAAIESVIGITSSNVASLQHDMEEQQRRAANFERRGKPVPDELLEEMRVTKRRIAEKEAIIQQKRQEQDAIRAQYDADLERFRKLTSERD